MTPLPLIAVLLCSYAAVSLASEIAPSDPALQQELLAMMQAEQAAMHSNDARAKQALLEQHTSRMKAIVAQVGWPTNRMVGSNGAQAAWLLVQHADHDKVFQQAVLKHMQPLVANQQIDASHYAYLYDRTHQPQRFGTQGACKDGRFEPFAIENPDQVDTRRQQYQLAPLHDYIEQATRMMCHAGH